MDYTCVNYSVEAWEGRAYSYGMQVRVPHTNPVQPLVGLAPYSYGMQVPAPGCLTQTPAQPLVGLAPFACLSVKTFAERRVRTPSRMPVCLLPALNFASVCIDSLCRASMRLCVTSDSGCGRRAARWRGCTLTQSWSHAA